MYVYDLFVRVVWDPRKAASNQKKHGIRFADAETVLFDPFALARKTLVPRANNGSCLSVRIQMVESSSLSLLIAVRQSG
jgi:uncharacterized DUF497 family protein